MTGGKGSEVELDDQESNAELVLFQVKECYVYMIPPRKSAASYRADEWDINKWAWEGVLKVVSKGENCSIRLEDKETGDLYAQAPIRQDQPLPVEAVIDSSRFFVLRVEEELNGKTKHAFLGLGFRERPQAYDFQAAVFDHLKYLNKKKEAEEITQEYEAKPSADYSLKEGETLRLQLKNTKISGSVLKSKSLEKTLSGSGAREPMPNPDTPENYPKRSGVPCIVPPPPPPVLQPPPSPLLKTPSMAKPSASVSESVATASNATPVSNDAAEDLDEDFGDFQAA